jgi:hypothetical protein
MQPTIDYISYNLEYNTVAIHLTDKTYQEIRVNRATLSAGRLITPLQVRELIGKELHSIEYHTLGINAPARLEKWSMDKLIWKAAVINKKYTILWAVSDDKIKLTDKKYYRIS